MVHSNLKPTGTPDLPTPTDGETKAQMKEWHTDTENVEFQLPAVPCRNRSPTEENSQHHSSSGPEPPLPTSGLPNSKNISERREEDCQNVESQCTSSTTLGKCTRCTECTSAMQVNKK